MDINGFASVFNDFFMDSEWGTPMQWQFEWEKQLEIWWWTMKFGGALFSDKPK